MVFMGVRYFLVNSIETNWRACSSYIWVGLILFTSFHKSDGTMLTNKRNMVLETVNSLFLLPWVDVKALRWINYESNEHTFGGLGEIFRSFNLAKVIGIKENLRKYKNSIFSGDMKTYRAKSELGGYQENPESMLIVPNKRCPTI